MNQYFEILNLIDYNWKVAEEKLEPNWFEGSALMNRIIWVYYHMLVKALTALPVTRRMKMSAFAYLTHKMKKKEEKNYACSNNASIISLTFMYMEVLK